MLIPLEWQGGKHFSLKNSVLPARQVMFSPSLIFTIFTSTFILLNPHTLQVLLNRFIKTILYRILT